MNIDGEELYPIPEHQDYFITKTGKVFSMKPRGGDWMGGGFRPTSPKRIGQTISRGYHVVNLSENKQFKLHFVSRLVLETFVGKCPKGMMCCHGIKGSLVDSLDNVSWGTWKKNNIDDKIRDGTYQFGENNPHAKLNELQVRTIRRAYYMGVNKHCLSDIFGVSPDYIRKIAHYQYWKHL